jgi:hypothetical protein
MPPVSACSDVTNLCLLVLFHQRLVNVNEIYHERISSKDLERVPSVLPYLSRNRYQNYLTIHLSAPSCQFPKSNFQSTVLVDFVCQARMGPHLAFDQLRPDVEPYPERLRERTATTD